MADTPTGNEVALTGTTAVTLVAAPASGKQRLIPANGATVYNGDTVAHNFTLQKNKNSTIYVIEYVASVAAGATYAFASPVVLDATDESLEIKDDATATTTEPTAQVALMETS